MFFILSKTLTYLVLPVSILAVLLLIFIFIRHPKVKKISFILFAGFFFIFTNPLISNELMLWWEIPAKPISELQPPYSAAIILTGVTATDKTMPDRVHLHKGADRIMHPVQLYKAGIVPRIIVTGGSGKLITDEQPSEAVQIKKVLLISGVAEEDIILETASRNTYENAINTARLLAEKDIPNHKLLLVTSAFHMRRSLGCFQQAGLSPQPFSTDFYSSDRTFTPDDILIPSEGALAIWTTLFKEWLGYIVYNLMGYL